MTWWKVAIMEEKPAICRRSPGFLVPMTILIDSIAYLVKNASKNTIKISNPIPVADEIVRNPRFV